MLRIFFISSCSGEITAKVIPNNVSGLVVKTSKARLLSVISSLNCAPADFPIQFFCIDFTFSGHSPISSRPLKSSSEYFDMFKNH